MDCKTARFLAPALLALAAACGGDPKALCDDGYQELNSGKHAAALKSFEAALEELDGNTSDPQFVRASMGAIEARVKVEPARAATDFLAFAKDHAGSVTDRDFSSIGGKLASERAFDPAVQILTKGLETYPQSPHLAKALQAAGDMARTAGDQGALDKFKGLGYVGNG